MKPKTETTRKGRWAVVDDGGGLVSQHNTSIEALQEAANWALSHAGRTCRVEPPAYEVVALGVQDPPPDPSPTDPEEPKETGPSEGFTELDWSGSADLPAGVSREAVQQALDRHDKVRLAAGSVIGGGLALSRPDQQLGVHGEGDRPRVEPKPGEHGLRIDITRGSAWVQGIAVMGPADVLQKDIKGIRFQLEPSSSDRTVTVNVEDCEVAHFDTLLHAVDNNPRVRGWPGRLALRARRNILHRARGSDNTTTGIYCEGHALGSLIEESLIADIGVPGSADFFDQGIYNVPIGEPLMVRNNTFYRVAAMATKLEHGGHVHDNLIVRCGMGPMISGPRGFPSGKASMIGNVVADQVDIDPDDPQLQRGHAYQPFVWNMEVRSNVAMRRLGSMKRHPAYQGYPGSANLPAFKENFAYQWADDELNFEVNNRLVSEVGFNRTVAAAKGLPTREELAAVCEREMNRPRGVWYGGALPMIQRCREALGMGGGE